VYTQGPDITFWYTDNTFFQNTTSSSSISARENELDQLGYRQARLIWVDGLRNRILGSDFHNSCSTSGLRDGGKDLEVGGSRFYDIGPVMYDGTARQCHANAISLETDTQSDINIHDSNTEGRIQVQDGTSSAKLNVTNTWLHGSSGMGISIEGSYRGTATLRNLFGWNNGPNGDYNIYGSSGSIDITSNPVSNLHLRGTGTSNRMWGVPPSGASATDDAQARNLNSNPALVWRAAHAYDSWVNYLY
jgi:hypothetical protein